MSCGYRVRLKATADAVWRPIGCIGGATGWYYANVLWRLRGILDRMTGGVGLRRGRRVSSDIRIGDALNFWRVLAVDPSQRLLLLAEMKMHGEALLEFKITPVAGGVTELTMLSRFLPKGLFKDCLLVYTLFLSPNNISRHAESHCPDNRGADRHIADPFYPGHPLRLFSADGIKTPVYCLVAILSKTVQCDTRPWTKKLALPTK